jgi:hypothetical protein
MESDLSEQCSDVVASDRLAENQFLHRHTQHKDMGMVAPLCVRCADGDGRPWDTRKNCRIFRIDSFSPFSPVQSDESSSVCCG